VAQKVNLGNLGVRNALSRTHSSEWRKDSQIELVSPFLQRVAVLGVL